MKTKNLFIILFLCQFSHITMLFAQDIPAPEPPKLVLLARAYSDSIVLRWAPDDAAAWSIANQYGYHIVRSYVGNDSTYISETLTAAPLKPMTLEEMKLSFGPSDTMAAIAAQALFGKDFQPAGGPVNTGNLASAIMKQNEIQQMRYAYAMQACEFNAKVANALALRYCDKTVKKGILYDYTILSLVPATIVSMNPGYAILRNEPPTPLEAPKGLNIRQSTNKKIELIWLRDTYSGYFIERSTDGGKTFSRMNHRPYYTTLPNAGNAEMSAEAAMYTSLLQDYNLYTDSIINGKKYHYRISGLNSFGERTPFSESVSITPVDLEVPNAPMINPIESMGDYSKITWQTAAIDADLKGFRIQKSNSPNGNWIDINTELIPKNISSYLDKSGNKGSAVYYRVEAEDLAGNKSQSFPAKLNIEDSLPPVSPLGLRGIIYREGIVELFWESNPEKDVKGYRVMYANQADHKFTVLTPKPIQNNYYRDSINLNTLTKNIFYKIIAEDLAGNQSEFSTILKLSRPDIVPPSKVVVLESSQDDETVKINWSLSVSKDVANYLIYRKPADTEEWQLIRTLESNTQKDFIHFQDTPPPAKAMFQYSVNVRDSAGNTSGLCKPLAFRVKGKSNVEIPLSISAVYDKEKNVIVVSWTGEYHEPFYYQLFRSTGKEVPSLYKSLESVQKSFTDTRIKKGSSNNYSIRIAFKDGRKSVMSKVVTIDTKD